MNENASYVSMPTPYDRDRRGEPGCQPASAGAIVLRGLAELANREHEQPHQRRSARDARLEQHAQPLVVEDRRVDRAAAWTRHGDACLESLAEERIRLELGLEGGPERRQPAASDCLIRLLGHEPAAGEEGVLQRPEGSRERDMDEREEDDQQRPEPAGLPRAEPEEHEQLDEEHDDARPRAAGEHPEAEQRERKPPAALLRLEGEREGERHQHDQRRAECDRVLGGGVRAQLAAAAPAGRVAELARQRALVKERHHLREMVEDVVARPRLVDRGRADDRASGRPAS